MTTADTRVASASVNRLFVDRWSPRSFAEATITEEELLAIIEAGRWAPSAYNSQPWRFVYARKGTPAWDAFLSWLVPFNQSWAGKASALIYVVANTKMVPPGATDPVDSRLHAYDAGAAAVQVMLQATHAGWITHAMSGLDVDAANTGLGLPEIYMTMAAIAVGKQGPVDLLPDFLQAREAPSDRLTMEQIAFEGGFKVV